MLTTDARLWNNRIDVLTRNKKTPKKKVMNGLDGSHPRVHKS